MLFGTFDMFLSHQSTTSHLGISIYFQDPEPSMTLVMKGNRRFKQFFHHYGPYESISTNKSSFRNILGTIFHLYQTNISTRPGGIK